MRVGRQGWICVADKEEASMLIRFIVIAQGGEKAGRFR